MAIYNKSLLIQNLLELQDQYLLFGGDNVPFKIINLLIRQRYSNLCNKFKLKKFLKESKIYINFISIKD